MTIFKKTLFDEENYYMKVNYIWEEANIMESLIKENESSENTTQTRKNHNKSNENFENNQIRYKKLNLFKINHSDQKKITEQKTIGKFDKPTDIVDDFDYCQDIENSYFLKKKLLQFEKHESENIEDNKSYEILKLFEDKNLVFNFDEKTELTLKNNSNFEQTKILTYFDNKTYVNKNKLICQEKNSKFNNEIKKNENFNKINYLINTGITNKIDDLNITKKNNYGYNLKKINEKIKNKSLEKLKENSDDNDTIDFNEDLAEESDFVNSEIITKSNLKELEDKFENKNIIKENFNHDSCCICDYDLILNEKNTETIDNTLDLLNIEENKKIFTLPCNHNFHKICFIKWFNIKRVCPLCRFILNVDVDKPIKNNVLNYFDVDNNMNNIENINFHFKINKDLSKNVHTINE